MRLKFDTRNCFHRTTLVASLVVAISMPSVTMAEERQIEFGYEFKEFTLYNRDEGPLKNDVLFVFHGFASAMPNGAYRGLHNKLSEQYSVIGFNYDYFDLEANDEAMDLVWQQVLKGRNVTFAGTSLGGFWANYYAQKYSVERLLLVNPVVDPLSQLRQFIGNVTVEKREKMIVVTEEDINQYTGRKSEPSADIDRMILLTRDDKILDYRLAEQWYNLSDTELVIFDEGGHTLNLREERYREVIGEFLLTE